MSLAMSYQTSHYIQTHYTMALVNINASVKAKTPTSDEIFLTDAHIIVQDESSLADACGATRITTNLITMVHFNGTDGLRSTWGIHRPHLRYIYTDPTQQK